MVSSREAKRKAAAGVTVAVTRIPSPTGTDMVRIEAVWPPGQAEWLVRMTGEDFADAAVLAGRPHWSWTGFLPAGSYAVHVEGFKPAPFEVTP